VRFVCQIVVLCRQGMLLRKDYAHMLVSGKMLSGIKLVYAKYF